MHHILNVNHMSDLMEVSKKSNDCWKIWHSKVQIQDAKTAFCTNLFLSKNRQFWWPFALKSKSDLQQKPVFLYMHIYDTHFRIQNGWITNSMEQNHSWEANNSSTSQKLPCILWNLRIYHHVHKIWVLKFFVATDSNEMFSGSQLHQNVKVFRYKDCFHLHLQGVAGGLEEPKLTKTH